MTSKKNLSPRLRPSSFRCLLAFFVTLSLMSAGRTPLAQIDPRRMTPVVLAAGGPTGPYFERFGLRYYREEYPETICYDDFTCFVQGDDHADDIYFPSTELEWI